MTDLIDNQDRLSSQSDKDGNGNKENELEDVSGRSDTLSSRMMLIDSQRTPKLIGRRGNTNLMGKSYPNYRHYSYKRTTKFPSRYEILPTIHGQKFDRTNGLLSYSQNESLVDSQGNKLDHLETFNDLKKVILSYGKLTNKNPQDKGVFQKLVRPGFSARRYIVNLLRYFSEEMVNKWLEEGHILQKTIFQINPLRPSMKRRLSADLSRYPEPYRILQQMLMYPGPLTEYSFVWAKTSSVTGEDRVLHQGDIRILSKPRRFDPNDPAVDVDEEEMVEVDYSSLEFEEKKSILSNILVKSAVNHALKLKDKMMEQFVQPKELPLADSSSTVNPAPVQEEESAKMDSPPKLDMIEAVTDLLNKDTIETIISGNFKPPKGGFRGKSLMTTQKSIKTYKTVGANNDQNIQDLQMITESQQGTTNNPFQPQISVDVKYPASRSTAGSSSTNRQESLPPWSSSGAKAQPFDFSMPMEETPPRTAPTEPSKTTSSTRAAMLARLKKTKSVKQVSRPPLVLKKNTKSSEGRVSPSKQMNDNIESLIMPDQLGIPEARGNNHGERFVEHIKQKAEQRKLDNVLPYGIYRDDFTKFDAARRPMKFKNMETSSEGRKTPEKSSSKDRNISSAKPKRNIDKFQAPRVPIQEAKKLHPEDLGLPPFDPEKEESKQLIPKLQKKTTMPLNFAVENQITEDVSSDKLKEDQIFPSSDTITSVATTDVQTKESFIPKVKPKTTNIHGAEKLFSAVRRTAKDQRSGFGDFDRPKRPTTGTPREKTGFGGIKFAERRDRISSANMNSSGHYVQYGSNRHRGQRAPFNPLSSFVTWSYISKETAQEIARREFLDALASGDHARLVKLLTDKADMIADAVLKMMQGGKDLAVDVNEAIRQILMQTMGDGNFDMNALKNSTEYKGMIKNIFKSLFKDQLGGVDLDDIEMTDDVMLLLQSGGKLTMDDIIIETDPLTGKKVIRLKDPEKTYKNIFKSLFKDQLEGIDAENVILSDEIKALLASGATIDPDSVYVYIDPVTGERIIKLKNPELAAKLMLKNMLGDALEGLDLNDVELSDEIKFLLANGGKLDPDSVYVYIDPVTGERIIKLKNPEMAAKQMLRNMLKGQLDGIDLDDVTMSDDIKFLLANGGKLDPDSVYVYIDPVTGERIIKLKNPQQTMTNMLNNMMRSQLGDMDLPDDVQMSDEIRFFLQNGGKLDPDSVYVYIDPITGEKIIKLKNPEAAMKNVFKNMLKDQLGDISLDDITISDEVKFLMQNGGVLDPNLIEIYVDPVTGERIVRLKNPELAAKNLIKNLLGDKLEGIDLNDVILSDEIKLLLQGGGKLDPDQFIIFTDPITGQKIVMLKNPENAIKNMFKDLLKDQLGDLNLDDFEISEEVKLLLKSGGKIDPDLLEIYIDPVTGARFVRLKNPEQSMKSVFKNLFKELEGVDLDDIEMSDEIRFLLQTGSKLDPDQFEVYIDPVTGKRIIRLKDPEQYFKNLNMSLDDIKNPEKFRFGAKAKAPKGKLNRVNSDDGDNLFYDEEGRLWRLNSSGDYEAVTPTDSLYGDGPGGLVARKKKYKTYNYDNVDDPDELIKMLENLDPNSVEYRNIMKKLGNKGFRRGPEGKIIYDSDLSDNSSDDSFDSAAYGSDEEAKRAARRERRRMKEEKLRQEMGEEAFWEYKRRKKEKKLFRQGLGPNGQRLSQMDPVERKEYLRRMEKEEEEKLLSTMTDEQKVEYFKKKAELRKIRDAEESRLALEEARRLAREHFRLKFSRGVKVEIEGLKRYLNMTPAFAWSYFQFLQIINRPLDPKSEYLAQIAK